MPAVYFRENWKQYFNMPYLVLCITTCKYTFQHLPEKWKSLVFTENSSIYHWQFPAQPCPHIMWCAMVQETTFYIGVRIPIVFNTCQVVISNSWRVGMIKVAGFNVTHILSVHVTVHMWFWRYYVFISDCFQVISINNRIYNFPPRILCYNLHPLTPLMCLAIPK